MVSPNIDVQILHDEISTSLLELSQVEERNQTLAKDNAKLLQRWLDAKQAEANRMNEANQFYENMRSRHDTVLTWRDGSAPDGPSNSRPPSSSGKELANPEALSVMTKNGALSPMLQSPDLTPNG